MIVKPNNVGRGESNTLPYLPNPSSRSAQPMHYMTSYPLQFTLFDAVAVAQPLSESTPEINVLGRNLLAVAVTGTFDATVKIEATLDGKNWVQLASITTPGITQYDGIYRSIRATIPTYVSGEVTVAAISQRS